MFPWPRFIHRIQERFGLRYASPAAILAYRELCPSVRCAEIEVASIRFIRTSFAEIGEEKIPRDN